MIELRSYNDDTDRGFVYSTWLRGLYYGNSYFGSIDKDVFFEKYESVLDHILTTPGVTITIAGLADDADSILGYIVRNGAVVHWAHVKAPWRKRGIAKQLAGRSEISVVTHVTPAGNAIRLKNNWGHNPFKIQETT